MIFDYEKTKTLEERQKEILKIRKKYPTKIPVLLQFDKHFDEIKRVKYLVPNEHEFGMFLATVRKHVKLNENEAIFTFVNGTDIVSLTDTMHKIHKEYSDPEWPMLKIYVCKENAFGKGNYVPF